MTKKPYETGQTTDLSETRPHYYGHRERLRGRFREAGAESVNDYELLELQFISTQAAGLERECRDGWRSVLPLASD